MPFLLGLLSGVLLATLLGGALLGWLLRKSKSLERRAAEAERPAELGMLTGGLAHELKNPLSTLQLNLQLLREDLEERLEQSAHAGDDEVAKLRRMVRRLHGLNNETTRLREILDDFLRYAGRLEVEPQPVDLRELAEEMVDFLAPQAQLARVRVEVSSTGVAPRAHADPKLIKQALLNLLLNAIQHTPDGGAVTVRVSPVRAARGQRGEVRVEVSDTGEGIPEEERLRVFEPYFSRRKGGTGLGLATTRRIVKAHGGDISVESAPGQGSRFILHLPAAKDVGVLSAPEPVARVPAAATTA